MQREGKPHTYERHSSSGHMKFAIVALIVLIVALGAFAWWRFFQSAPIGVELARHIYQGDLYVLVQYDDDLAIFDEAGRPVASRSAAEAVIRSYVWTQAFHNTDLSGVAGAARMAQELDSDIADARSVSNTVVNAMDRLDGISASVPFMGRVSALGIIEDSYPGLDTLTGLMRDLNSTLNEWGDNSAQLAESSASLESLSDADEIDALEAERAFLDASAASQGLASTMGEIRSAVSDASSEVGRLANAMRNASDTPIIGGSLRSLAGNVGGAEDALSSLAAGIGGAQQELNSIAERFATSVANATGALDGYMAQWMDTPHDATWPPADPARRPVQVAAQPTANIPTAQPVALAPTPVPAAAPTAIPAATPTFMPNPTPTQSPTAMPTPIPTATNTPTPIPMPTQSPTATPTPVPTATPTPDTSHLPVCGWAQMVLLNAGKRHDPCNTPTPGATAASRPPTRAPAPEPTATVASRRCQDIKPNADLSGCDFAESDLSGLNLSGVNFTDAILYFADLSETDLMDATLHNAIVDGINLSKVDLTRTTLTGITSFQDALLTRAVFTKDARLRNVSFAGADLSYADLRGADLAGADFSSANLYGAQFDWAVMDDALFRNAYADEASFIRAVLNGASFINTDIDDARFDGADLTGAVFRRVQGASSAEFLRTTCPDGVVSDDCYREGRLEE